MGKNSTAVVVGRKRRISGSSVDNDSNTGTSATVDKTIMSSSSSLLTDTNTKLSRKNYGSDDGKDRKKKIRNLEVSKTVDDDQVKEDNDNDEVMREEEEVENDVEGRSEAEEILENPASNHSTTNTITTTDGKYRNKQRCLTLCSRNVTARYRHLLEDLRTLIPHHKKETKLDSGTNENIGSAVQQIAEMRGCNTVLFLECRKHQDAYLWLGRTGYQHNTTATPSSSTATTTTGTTISTGGPSVKFYVTNIHTMDELKLTGNCMKYSRPILSFDESFNRLGHLKLIKELFIDIFTTPRGHPKSKPFMDRIMSFYYADNRVSNYKHCVFLTACLIVW
jgi:Brix domain